MHSLKNTIVAVGLLAVSFGLYQVSLTPKTDTGSDAASPGEFSDGISQLANHAISGMTSELDGVQSKVDDFKSDMASIPGSNLPGAGSKALQPPMLSQASPPTVGIKQPLVSTVENNVQTLQYSAEDKPATSIATPEISQRELVDTARDQGLIDALENQMDFESQRSAPISTPDSSPSNPLPLENNIERNDFDTSGEYQFAVKTDPLPSTVEPISTPGSAQPIASGDSSFNDFASSTAASPIVKTTTAPDADANNFDANVRQASAEPALEGLSFNAAWPKVDQLVAAGEFRNALKLLSRFYDDASLNGPQRQRLLGNLDALAGKVIYSQENHFASSAYVVGPGESLTDVAEKWNVPAQLIFNVNQKSIPNPAMIAPGTELKMVPGPFRSVVDLDANVMTLFLGDLYAGRFPIRVGISGEPKPGSFKVLVKSELGFAWRDSDGIDYPPGTPENGYGPNWIGLTESLCIHAIPDSAQHGHHGCIGLSPKDAKDVFAILAEDSEVTILR